MLSAQTVITSPTSNADLRCSLNYSDRFVRRKRLHTDCGMAFLLDLDKVTNLKHTDQLKLDDQTLIEIIAKPEMLAEITGDKMLEYVWHLGNRHTPAQVEAKRILIQHDHVIEHMIEHLGGSITHITEPFMPLGGAYGHGRTHSHEHVKSIHAHTH